MKKILAIGVSIAGEPNEITFGLIAKWFNYLNYDIPDISIGELIRSETNDIEFLGFSLTDHSGTVDYFGHITIYGDLFLESYSHINSNRNEHTYEYVGYVENNLFYPLER